MDIERFRASRHSHFSKWGQAATAIGSAFLFSVGELMQMAEAPKVPHPIQSVAEMRLRLYDILGPDANIRCLAENRDVPDEIDEFSINPVSAATTRPASKEIGMGEVAVSSYYGLLSRFDSFGEFIGSCNTYRMSEEQCQHVDPSTIDCNDHAYRACERLQQEGLPMNIVTIWPADTETRKENGESWHELAVCMLEGNKYLIVDNHWKMTIWDGSLESFVDQYDTNMPMEIVRVSRHVRPKHDCPASKFIIGMKNFITVEEIENAHLKEDLPLREGIEIASTHP